LHGDVSENGLIPNFMLNLVKARPAAGTSKEVFRSCLECIGAGSREFGGNHRFGVFAKHFSRWNGDSSRRWQWSGL